MQGILRISIFTIFSILFSLSGNSQYDKPLWGWESHLPSQIVKQIAQSDEYIFYATRWSIVRVDKDELTTRKYSEIEGLSETGIEEIAYDNKEKQLIIAYSNGVLDFLQEDNTIVSIADFQQNTTFQDKTINSITVTSEGKIYYSTRFGVVAQNSDDYLFEFTTNIGLNVLAVKELEKNVFAATEDGIYHFENDGIKNPGDFTAWEFMGESVGLPIAYETIDLEIYNGELYAIINDQVYVFRNDSWLSILADNEDFEYISLSAESKNLVIGEKGDSYNSRIWVLNETGEAILDEELCGNSMLDVIESSDGKFWYADNWHGFRIKDGFGSPCQKIFFNSPYSYLAKEIRVKDNAVYVASGGINENFGFDSNKDGFYVLRENDWSNFNGNTVGLINEISMLNFTVVQPHPTKNITYAGAFPGGLLEINHDTGETKAFYSENSVIKGPPIAEYLERVIDLKFDEDENLWISVFGTEDCLHVLTPEGIWHSFSFDNVSNLGAMEIDDFGNLWFQLGGQNGGVLVFDHNNSIADPSNDDFHIFTRSNSAMTANRVYSLKKDLSGDIWVGTLQGPVIFECGDIFPDKSCEGSIRKVLQDSIPAPLLETEPITSITVDGANRKWLGSGTGIYVQSPNGEDQELRFTTDNSPLFDNNIIDLEYNSELGEIYIATSKGLQSVRIDATGAVKFFDKSNMYAFPNPVRPEYNGDIAIQGLAEDANVKITDISGRLVYETTAKGGLATWNGFDYSGNRANSGVYTVIATYTKDLSNVRTETTKILIVD